MIVTSITGLDRKRSRVLLDQGPALVLLPEELRAFGIEEGKEITDGTYRRLVEQVLTSRAKERVVKALMVSDKTEKQLREMLAREGYPDKACKDALDMAKQYRYVDDEAFGARYVENQAARKSKRQLAFDMERKGFGRELVQELLAGHPIDEKSQIRRLLEKKGYRPEDSLDRKTYGKLVGMLARKGYTYEVISEVLREPERDFD